MKIYTTILRNEKEYFVIVIGEIFKCYILNPKYLFTKILKK